MTPMEILIDILVSGAAGLSGYGVTRAGGHIWAKRIQLNSEAAALRRRLKRCTALVPRFTQRHVLLRSQLQKAEAQRREIERRLASLRRQTADAADREDELIRLVGRRRPGYRLFKAILTNRHVQGSLREGRPHPLLDGNWARPQNVEIWAGTIQEAKTLLSGRFSTSLGFVVLDLREAGDDEYGTFAL